MWDETTGENKSMFTSVGKPKDKFVKSPVLVYLSKYKGPTVNNLLGSMQVHAPDKHIFKQDRF
jgi:hypothetical protein